MKDFNHKLLSLFKHAKQSIPVNFDASWDVYLLELQEAYSRRYPDQWVAEMVWKTDLDRLDQAYAYLRKGIVQNFPTEEVEQARKFGGNIIGAYEGAISESISKSGGMPPQRILELNNKCFSQFAVA